MSSTIPGKPREDTEDTEGTAAAGNARLTGSTGLVLLLLFAVQVGTVVIGVKTHVTLHVFVGLLLVPPLLTKIASVARRFIGYYRHERAYQRRGAPPLPLRVLGPVLLGTTLLLFITGITEFLAPTVVVSKIHDVSAYLWLVLVLAHLAGHGRDIRRTAIRDWLPRARAAVPGAALRQAAILASLAAGLALALALVSHVGTFHNEVNHSQGPRPTATAVRAR
jgi:hypothetical protein